MVHHFVHFFQSLNLYHNSVSHNESSVGKVNLLVFNFFPNFCFSLGSLRNLIPYKRNCLETILLSWTYSGFVWREISVSLRIICLLENERENKWSNFHHYFIWFIWLSINSTPLPQPKVGKYKKTCNYCRLTDNKIMLKKLKIFDWKKQFWKFKLKIKSLALTPNTQNINT